MKIEPIEAIALCFCCEQRMAITKNSAGLPLCAPCWGLHWAKTELSQPPKPGDEQLRTLFRVIEENLTRCLVQ